jgi:hypothetical protein
MKKLDRIAKLLEGFSSIICLFPQENKRKLTLPTSSVKTSLNNDWQNIALDMWQSFRTIESQKIEINHRKENNEQLKRYPKPPI